MTDRGLSRHGVEADASSFWGQRLGRDVSADEGRSIAENLCGFLTVLAEWADAEGGTRRETPNSEARPPPRAQRSPTRSWVAESDRADHSSRVTPSGGPINAHPIRSDLARET